MPHDLFFSLFKHRELFIFKNRVYWRTIPYIIAQVDK